MDPDHERLRTANRQFYEAFAAGDSAAMSALWADEAAVACIHPGRDAIHGRAAVLKSWRAILDAPARPGVVFLDGEAACIGDFGVIVGTEAVLEARLSVTNLFVKGPDQEWKMVLHHASPVSGPMPISEALLRLKPHWN